MGFVLISVFLAIVVWLLYFKRVPRRERTSEGLTAITALIGVLVAGGLAVGLTVNLGQYGPIKEVEEIRLRSIYDNGEEKYIRISPKNTHMYRVDATDVKSSEGDAYAYRTIEGDNVTIVEENNNTSPRLVKYVQEHKITFWTFGIGNEKTFFVFYIPEGTAIAGLSAD